MADPNITVTMPLITTTSDPSFGFPGPAIYNYSNINTAENLAWNQGMAWLLASLMTTLLWVIYVSFYNSRIVGYFVTRLVNRFAMKGVYFKIGSLTINPLAGKFMFRDVVFACFDYSLRVQDGYFIFRWWRTYVPKDVSEDLSHSDTRLSVMLNGMELHVYNRSDLYAHIERTFGLKPSVLVPHDHQHQSAEEAARMRELAMNLENERKNSLGQAQKLRKQKSEAMTATTWRDLIPVIKIDICSGRFVFGNRLTPTTLSVCVEEAHCIYSTKPAVSRLDHFMHFVKAKVENAKILLVPSPKYTGLVDEPPRYMGEGFVVMMSNQVELYFYMDEPGIVPDEPVLLTLANGDVVEPSPPVWGVDLKCGKVTNFSYGPWADRQRDHLFRFFFPPDWQTMVVTPAPLPGEKRQFKSFEVSLITLNEATIDVLFSKNKETNAMHVTTGPGSYLEVSLPWVTLKDGFTTKISGQLLHVEATTSLQYRSLAKCETLEFKVHVKYPLRWNAHQEWAINLTGCKATAYLVYSHKHFFQDLIEDWGSKARPDVLSFVPYTWKFCILLKEFEILTLCNEFNWIDCSSTNQENNHLAFCGDLFDLSFNLPFDDFLPATVPLCFWIHGEGLDLSLYLPEISTSRPIVLALDENLRLLQRDGTVRRRRDMLSKKWRKDCTRSAGWVDCWSVPIVALSIAYTYHPMPPLGPDPQADITTPEKEEILLSPMRIPKSRSPAMKWKRLGADGAPISQPALAQQPALPQQQQFDPTTLPADTVTVDIEIGSSILLAYGTVARNFINLKENIFGEDQAFTDMGLSNAKQTMGNLPPVPAAAAVTTKTSMMSAAAAAAVAAAAAASASASGNSSGSNRCNEDNAKSISEVSATAAATASAPEERPKRFDPRLYRPLDVTVTLTIHDIQAHLLKNCNDTDPPCPVVLIERLGFEMRKRYFETELQILVSPSFLIVSDAVVRPGRDRHLRQGQLLMSSLQIRGHAMFSSEGRSLDDETLEYAWLLEVQLGKLSGKLTLPQLVNVVTGLETMFMLALDAENEMRPPRSLRYCHHGVASQLCAHTRVENKYRCPTTEDIKYRMTRVAIDAIDFYLVESGTALHAWISPIRVSTCNLHGQKVKSGVTGLISTILIRHFVSTSGHFHIPTANGGAGMSGGNNNTHSNTNTTGSGRSQSRRTVTNADVHADDAHGGGSSGGLAGGAKKEDLNVLLNHKRSDGSEAGIKFKRESDYMRRGSRDRDDISSTAARRSRDSEHSQHRMRGGVSTATTSTTATATTATTMASDRDEAGSTTGVNGGGGGAGGHKHVANADADPWLEVGCVSMGPIIIESASALPIPEHCLHLVQHNFLKVHDKRTRRLWFLWSSTVGGVDASRCGCTGGCAFFGSNINGHKFFKPTAQDMQDGINIARFHIHANAKEYGYGQSLLYDGQLVFHTPPYSLQPVSLQDGNESIGKANIRIIRPPSAEHHGAAGAPDMRRSPMPHHRIIGDLSPQPLPPPLPVSSTVMIPLSKTASGDRVDRHSSYTAKMNHSNNGGGGGGVGSCSPSTLERRSRRFSSANSRQNINSHEVPYARLLDSPSRITKPKEPMSGGMMAMSVADTRVSPTMSMRQPMQLPYHQQQYPHDGLMTPRALRIPTSKTSASDSKLTVDYFQPEPVEHVAGASCVMPDEMSHSAPQPHPLESDSDPSLSPKMLSEDEIVREVQRTISLTSENPSEAFFSADEDLHTSRSSSLRTADHRLLPHPKKRFASDLSIGGSVAGGVLAGSVHGGSTAAVPLEAKLSTHRSDYEIHSPEHRSISKRPQSTAELTDDDRRMHGLLDTPMRKMCSISPRPEFRHFKPVYDAESQESSSGSPSLSSNSFISAMSSQEDITLVNLHMQVNKPIIDSPLLMASYVTHLAQLRCANWTTCCLPFGADSFSTPLFQQNDDGGLVYIGSKLVPHFDTYSNWREVRIVARQETGSTAASTAAAVQQHMALTAPRAHPWDPSVMLRGSGTAEGVTMQKHGEEDAEFMTAQSDTATRNSVIIRLKGHVEVMLTPLLLEGLQRMIEIVVPTLSTLHPLTVVNYLHSSCIGKVEAANILKRDQSLSYWSQVHSNSKRSTAERNLLGPGGPVMTDVYEESISTQLQGLVVIQKINVSLIQSSVVEEVISFAALDNVQDLSCASLLAVSFDGIQSRFHLGKTTKASMHTVYTQPTVRSSGLKKGRIMKSTRALLSHLSSQSRADNIPGEPILIETSEKQQEELVITLDICKAHAQLRRLKNEGCALQENQTIVTAIPSHKSRAMFECLKFPEDVASDAATLGFIMFECGLEGIGTKIVKRSQFEKSENAENGIKTSAAGAPLLATDGGPTVSTATVTSGQHGSTVIEMHAAPLSVSSSAAAAPKTTESTSKFSIKRPGTPKTNATRVSDTAKSTGEPASAKDTKIKFSFKPSTATVGAAADAINVSPLPQTPQPTATASTDDKDKSTAGSSTAAAAATASNAVVSVSNNNGRTSSCVIDFKTVWFNFAAPPRAPITRKIDFTRLDWNLLSTASPAITAWMNPSNRFAIKVVAMLKAMHLRRTAVTACLMTDGLDVPGIQKHAKSRYSGKFTPLAKTLQEDPSCQLCTMMQKLAQHESIDQVEAMLRQQDLPQLTTLRQGVIVLSRQWKNMLYNPMLFEHQYKNKLNRPINVTFAVSADEDDDADTDGAQQQEPVLMTTVGAENQPLIGDGDENERTMLLGQAAVPQYKVIPMPDNGSESMATGGGGGHGHAHKHDGSVNSSPMKRKRSARSAIPPNVLGGAGAQSSSRSSLQMFPIISALSATDNGAKSSSAGIEYGTLPDSASVASFGSSVTSLDKVWQPAANQNDDLYSWMAKAHNATKKSSAKSKSESVKRPPSPPTRPVVGGVGAGVAGIGGGGGASLNGVQQDSVRLLDAHLIFEPILTCLGVMPQQMVNNITNADVSSLDSLGTNLSLVGSFDVMRIDIVVSEAGERKFKAQRSAGGSASNPGSATNTATRTNKAGGTGGGSNTMPKFQLHMADDQPAFLCERVGVELEVTKTTDGFADDIRPANMLYMSRGQLKNHTSTVINFSLNVRYISQQVNMPLLRLLHQITNMYQNVKEAQNELREQPVASSGIGGHTTGTAGGGGIHGGGGGGGGSTDGKMHGGIGGAAGAAKDESSLASEVNDATLMGSIHEPNQLDHSLLDECYDKFNESYQLGHSVSRTRMPTLGPLIPLTPSPSAHRNRPQSFAQKLKSTSKSVKGKLGYTNLNETVSTPMKKSPNTSHASAFESAGYALQKSSSEHKNSITGGASSAYGGDYGGLGAAGGGRASFSNIAPPHIATDTPACWKTMYHLLELYATMPETKTVSQRISPEAQDAMKTTAKKLLHSAAAAAASHHAVDPDETDAMRTGTPLPVRSAEAAAHVALGSVGTERTRLVVFGVAKIQKTRLLATLSGLKLEAEISSLHSSATWRKKSRPAALECSHTGQLGRVMIVLLEGVAPGQQTVVKVTVGKSQTLYSSHSRRGKDKNSGLVSIGAVNVDIPQHPVALHGMMTRSSKQLSSTLQELRVARTSTRLSRQNEEPESPLHVRSGVGGPTGGGAAAAGGPSDARDATTAKDRSTNSDSALPRKSTTAPQPAASTAYAPRAPAPAPPQPSAAAHSTHAATTTHAALLQPLVMQFNILLQSLSVTAALLPSLQAQYKMDHVSSAGVSGSKAKFTIDLPNHSLSFTTKIQASEANLPSEACIALPPIHVAAEYIQENATNAASAASKDAPLTIDGVVLRQGGYVSASAEIGDFERCLTTDLLNHLVFVQKVFMREVNEVVQKVYGGEKPVPLWLDDNGDTDNGGVAGGSSLKRILFSLSIRVKRIQLTATTPCSSAVRFETGALELHVSNRVKNMSDASSTRLFGKAQIDFNLSLGQIIKNVMFDEADPEFQQYAFFNTTINLRNAFQDEMLNDDKELVLITLKRPLIYIQPVAVDKAILVWLNYKNAYEYWAEKRANLNKEVLTATQQVFQKMPFGQIGQHLGSTHLSTLYLQLTVEDMGICLPLNPLPLATWPSRSYQEFESRGAVVITLENTIISACNSGSLVSTGKFCGLCLRFADDFETTLDDWKPNMNDASIMNFCVVSEGTYEVCSRTIAAKHLENAKWILNVKWQMEGVDIHLDVNVGKQLSALGHTLTTLSGMEEEEDATAVESPDSDDEEDGAGGGGEGGTEMSKEHGVLSAAKSKQRKALENFPAFLFDPTLDSKKRSILMEKEMNEQLKIINDLRTLGASNNTVAHEERRLQELQALCYKYFRRDMIKKWKRPSLRRPMLKSANRSQSFVAASPTNESTEAEQPSTGGGGGMAGYGGLDTICSHDELSGSLSAGTPNVGHSRSASLRCRGINQTQRVAFSEAMRQSSLPSADSEASFAPGESGGEDSDLSEVQILEVDGQQVELRSKRLAGGKQQEPNIDFELDIKVLVNSGKCVLHTKDVNDEKMGATGGGGGGGSGPTSASNSTSTSARHHKRERSIGTDWGSPILSRRNRDKNHRLRYNTPVNAVLVDLTIFHIPGLDVKLHYESKTIAEDCSPRLSTCDANVAGSGGGGGGGGGGALRRLGSKRASLFAWMTLQSVPEETIISPHILEFLEQTLEPIPFKSTDLASASTTNPAGVNIDLLQENYVAYASFPVDVIVYFHMQPSTFRFSCLPVSRVECMLQLPSLDIVFSSKRQDDDPRHAGVTGTPPPGTGTDAELHRLPSGGLSVTGCLADFNVYIFHPYGGGKKPGGFKDQHFSPLADSERKDSLSVNVEFVKFHLTRSRKMNIEHVTTAGGPATAASATAPPCGDRFKKAGGAPATASEQQRAVIRFSTIVDIGSASFKYDMRRLTEILAFPKAWYRRRIVRRLFLGDLSVPQPSAGASVSADGPTGSGAAGGAAAAAAAFADTDAPRGDRNPLLAAAANRNRLRLSLDGDLHKAARLNAATTAGHNGGGTGGASSESSSFDMADTPSEANAITAWETLVLFAFNFTRLNVQMNMGNVMGNVIWLTKAFRSDGRLSIGSTGHKNMYVGIGLGGSSLDAKGGIVGGTIELNRIDTHVHIREEPGREPHHTVGIKLLALELRLDYMGTSVLMTRISALNAQLRDEWKCSQEAASVGGANRPTIILIHGDLSWDQLQIMISKSTTADLLKMYAKLEEFFTQQFKSSKRVFSNLESRPTRLSRKQKRLQMVGGTAAGGAVGGAASAAGAAAGEPLAVGSSEYALQEARHHRHWQKPLKQAMGLILSTLGVPLPRSGTVLGGTMELHGRNISLACFHSVNFKAKSWALFSLRDPCINFATEAQQHETSSTVHVIQTLTFGLGVSGAAATAAAGGGAAAGGATASATAQNHSMATVCRMSRNIIFPPQFKTLHEWFHYAFASSEIDAVDRFPVLERDREPNTNSIERSRTQAPPNSGSGGSGAKLQDHSHNREVIFALPSLRLYFKTEHVQGAQTPEAADEKPVVECSFITEFEDHIFVTVDADAFFFLHDLITSYVKEKERVIGHQNLRSASPNPLSTVAGMTGSDLHGSAHTSEYTTTGNARKNLQSLLKSRTTGSVDAAAASAAATAAAAAAADKLDHLELEAFMKDWRHFECKTWHLEPTVRLLSWTGKSIEPYGVDYILNKLGFSHARTTIPKWLQRGCMDPLDKLEALMIVQLMCLVKDDRAGGGGGGEGRGDQK